MEQAWEGTDAQPTQLSSEHVYSLHHDAQVAIGAGGAGVATLHTAPVEDAPTHPLQPPSAHLPLLKP